MENIKNFHALINKAYFVISPGNNVAATVPLNTLYTLYNPSLSLLIIGS